MKLCQFSSSVHTSPYRITKNSKLLQIVDAVLVALLTGLVSLITVSIVKDCKPTSLIAGESLDAMKVCQHQIGTVKFCKKKLRLFHD